MTEETNAQSVNPDIGSYQAPSGGANYDQQALAALVEKLVADRMSSMGVEAPKPPPTPEEAARAAVDNRGVGLGIEERFGELYRHLDTVMKKVGL